MSALTSNAIRSNTREAPVFYSNFFSEIQVAAFEAFGFNSHRTELKFFGCQRIFFAKILIFASLMNRQLRRSVALTLKLYRFLFYWKGWYHFRMIHKSFFFVTVSSLMKEKWSFWIETIKTNKVVWKKIKALPKLKRFILIMLKKW